MIKVCVHFVGATAYELPSIKEAWGRLDMGLGRLRPLVEDVSVAGAGYNGLRTDVYVQGDQFFLFGHKLRDVFALTEVPQLMDQEQAGVDLSCCSDDVDWHVSVILGENFLPNRSAVG